MPFFEYAKIGIPLLIACSIFLYFFGSKLIADRDGNTQSDSQMDYSQIPARHRNLTLAVFILSIAGMVATDYIKFLPQCILLHVVRLLFLYSLAF